MAKEKTEEVEEVEAEEESQPKKKGLPLKLLAMGFMGLLVLGGGGFAAYKFYLAPKKAAEAKKAEKAKPLPLEKLVGPVVPLKTFIVNLADDSGNRYLKVTVELEAANGKVEEEIKKRLHEVRDSLITILTSKTFSQIRSATGKAALRDEVVARINTILTSGQVKKAFFTDFVVQ